MRVWARSPLPTTKTSPPSDAFSARTASAASPSSSVEFCHSTDVSVREATYFRMPFIRGVNGLPGSAVGQ